MTDPTRHTGHTRHTDPTRRRMLRYTLAAGAGVAGAGALAPLAHAGAAPAPADRPGTAHHTTSHLHEHDHGHEHEHEHDHEHPDIGALGDQSAVRTLRIGDTRLTYVVDGAMELDTVGFLPAVPASYWAEHPDALTRSGRIAASVGGVLVQRGHRRLLIDVGLGANVLSPSLGVSRGGALLRTLRALRVAPESIDTVAFTHLHTDHTGVGFLRDGDGVLRKAFPRAAYLVAGVEWEPYWRGEIEVGAPSWDDFVEPMSTVLRRFGDGDEVWPGVTALVTPGHSPGHTTYAVSASNGERVLVLGDAFHTPAQMAHPEWPSGPDVDVDGVSAARARLLAELAADRTRGFAFHFGDQAFGRVVRDTEGLAQWRPTPARKLLPAPVSIS